VSYRFKTVPSFRRALRDLDPHQKAAARKAFAIFKQNPFDPRLRPHKIHRLSAEYGVTIHAVCIEGDLRAVFYVEGDTVWSVDVGTHAIYRS
jgi:mRNA-degrading endonuclease YafQ of YafQ-DinJ toxin-antitoxin module